MCSTTFQNVLSPWSIFIAQAARGGVDGRSNLTAATVGASMILDPLHWGVCRDQQHPGTYRRKRALSKIPPTGSKPQGIEKQAPTPSEGRRKAVVTPKSILSIIGTIMSQMSTAIGALIWLPEPNS